MAAQAILVASPSSHPLLSIHSSSFNSSFHGVSLKLPRHSLALTLSVTPVSKKPFPAVAATNEAVSGLNSTSDDEGLVNLNQGYDGEEAINVDSEILLSDTDVEPDDELGPVAAVPKKRTSRTKSRIRKNVWKRKGYVAALKAYSLAKSVLTGKSTSFMTDNLKKDT